MCANIINIKSKCKQLKRKVQMLALPVRLLIYQAIDY